MSERTPRLHPAAAAELEAAWSFYVASSRKIAEMFVREIDWAMTAISRDLRAGP